MRIDLPDISLVLIGTTLAEAVHIHSAPEMLVEQIVQKVKSGELSDF